MAVYRQFSGELNIDVDTPAGGGVSAGRDYLVALTQAIEVTAAAVARVVTGLGDEEKPTDFELTFDLIALDGGGFAIARGEETSNFHVTMRWSGGGEGGLAMPELPGIGPGSV